MLLILIAIAAGVVVYAYVLGFVGNSTGNSGATTNTLSIDQVNLASSGTNSKIPVTVYVRNQGPGTEQFNTGLYLKSSSADYILGIAISVTASGSATPTITDLQLLAQSGNTYKAQATFTSCASGTTITVSALGTSSAIACGGVSGTVLGAISGAITASITFSGTNFIADTGAMTTGLTNVGGTSQVVGAPCTAGTFSISLNNVGTLTLAPAGPATGAVTNPLSAGSTYTVQVIGTDGGSTTSSGKAS